ncbi:MAG: universal stress protein [Acidimicrobiia bacterium]
MRHFVVPFDDSPSTQRALRLAVDLAGSEGTVVLIWVLPGSMVDKGLSPGERGRVRRDAENGARARAAARLAELAPGADCHVVVLFGDVVSDTLLLAANLGVDAIVMAAEDPAVSAMIAESEIPVVVAPQAEAPA